MAIGACAPGGRCFDASRDPVFQHGLRRLRQAETGVRAHDGDQQGDGARRRRPLPAGNRSRHALITGNAHFLAVDFHDAAMTGRRAGQFTRTPCAAPPRLGKAHIKVAAHAARSNRHFFHFTGRHDGLLAPRTLRPRRAPASGRDKRCPRGSRVRLARRASADALRHHVTRRPVQPAPRVPRLPDLPRSAYSRRRRAGDVASTERCPQVVHCVITAGVPGTEVCRRLQSFLALRRYRVDHPPAPWRARFRG